METKTCIICGKEKPTSEFHKQLNRFQSRCKECSSEWYTKKYEEDAEYRASKLAKHRENMKNPEFVIRKRGYFKARYKADPEAGRAKNYKRNYQITIAEYEEILAKQDGTCALCGRPEVLKRRLAVDHDHSHHEDSRKACKECIRGLLCQDCNRFHVPWLEANPHLQSDFVKIYLKCRPFLSGLNKATDSIVESKISVAPESNRRIPSTCGAFNPELIVHSAT
jgi:hypothetical protein